jgi:chorismate mutase / prephenate dehydratase
MSVGAAEDTAAARALSLEELRRRIDALDEAIVATLAHRVELARATRPRKGSVRDAAREAEVRAHVRELATRHGVDLAGVGAVYELVLALCREVQEPKED